MQCLNKLAYDRSVPCRIKWTKNLSRLTFKYILFIQIKATLFSEFAASEHNFPITICTFCTTGISEFL